MRVHRASESEFRCRSSASRVRASCRRCSNLLLAQVWPKTQTDTFGVNSATFGLLKSQVLGDNEPTFVACKVCLPFWPLGSHFGGDEEDGHLRLVHSNFTLQFRHLWSTEFLATKSSLLAEPEPSGESNWSNFPLSRQLLAREPTSVWLHFHSAEPGERPASAVKVGPNRWPKDCEPGGRREKEREKIREREESEKGSGGATSLDTLDWTRAAQCNWRTLRLSERHNSGARVPLANRESLADSLLCRPSPLPVLHLALCTLELSPSIGRASKSTIDVNCEPVLKCFFSLFACFCPLSSSPAAGRCGRPTGGHPVSQPASQTAGRPANRRPSAQDAHVASFCVHLAT